MAPVSFVLCSKFHARLCQQRFPFSNRSARCDKMLNGVVGRGFFITGQHRGERHLVNDSRVTAYKHAQTRGTGLITNVHYQPGTMEPSHSAWQLPDFKNCVFEGTHVVAPTTLSTFTTDSLSEIAPTIRFKSLRPRFSWLKRFECFSHSLNASATSKWTC